MYRVSSEIKAGIKEKNLADNKRSAIPEDRMHLYKLLLDTLPEIELKGKNNPYTSYNGHMFTFITREGTVAIRLPKDERQQFLDEHKTTLMESYGAVMKEYVRVPDALLSNTGLLNEYLVKSYEYIKTLKPKPAKGK